MQFNTASLGPSQRWIYLLYSVIILYFHFKSFLLCFCDFSIPLHRATASGLSSWRSPRKKTTWPRSCARSRPKSPSIRTNHLNCCVRFSGCRLLKVEGDGAGGCYLVHAPKRRSVVRWPKLSHRVIVGLLCGVRCKFKSSVGYCVVQLLFDCI